MAATQGDTLRMFTALRLVREKWAGSLLVAVGLNDAGRTLALASLAAGAASIFLEQDALQVRQAQREGCVTFSVTSLDEALRVVKNEVRQRHAISVALRGDSTACLQDMVDRGVQPQAFAASRALTAGEASSVDRLCERGMHILSGFALQPIRPGNVDLEDVLSKTVDDGWSVEKQGASSLAERRAQDAALLEAVTGEDAMSRIARQWLAAATAIFPRALDRSYWRKDRQDLQPDGPSSICATSPRPR